jgi:DNA repair exonuclease SbcCD nuclease subunit
MAKIAIITDTHAGVRSDNHAYYDYFKKFYDNIFFNYIDNHHIDTVLHLGDIVDRRKFINYVSLERFREDFIGPITDRGLDFHVLVGNHDIPYRNSSKLNAMDLLFDDLNVYKDPTEVEIHGRKMLFLPWITPENYNETMEKINASECEIALGHLEILGANMGAGMSSKNGINTGIFKKFKKVLSGHFHTRSRMENIFYIGNPYHLYWNDFADERGFTILDTETLEMELIKNPYTIFHKVYYDDTDKSLDKLLNIDYDKFNECYVKIIVVNKKSPIKFDRFLSKIYDANPSKIEIIDDDVITTEYSDEDIEQDTQDTWAIVEKYLHNTQTSTIKQEQLLYLFQALYKEAENMEY